MYRQPSILTPFVLLDNILKKHVDEISNCCRNHLRKIKKLSETYHYIVNIMDAHNLTVIWLKAHVRLSQKKDQQLKL